MSKNKLTGGLSNYYLVEVKHPQRDTQPSYIAECEDIADALGLTPNEFCEFKAIWRTANARKGNGKPDGKALYDAEKRMHYAKRDVLKYQREQETVADPDGWILHDSPGMPFMLNDDDMVEVILRDGTHNLARKAGHWSWINEDMPSTIRKWRSAGK